MVKDQNKQDFRSAKADVQESEVLITIMEGKFHQVKRMVKAVGSEVLYLKRLSMGSLKLDEELKLGNTED